jgi:hypothetical protein
MRKKYRTLEEVRAANAERQKRWREANRWLARERVQERYGRAQWQKEWAARMEERVKELERRVGGGAGCAINNEFQETRIEPIEGFDTPSAEYRVREEARRKRASMGQADERGVDKEDGGRPGYQGAGETENERATYRKLEALKAKRARGGVKVELEI